MLNYFIYALFLYGLLSLIIIKLSKLKVKASTLTLYIISFSLVMTIILGSQSLKALFNQIGIAVLINNLIFALMYYIFIKLTVNLGKRESIIVTLIFSVISFTIFSFAYNFILDLNHYNIYIQKSAFELLTIIVSIAANILIWLILLKLFKDKESFKSISALIPIVLPLITIIILLNLRRYIWFNTTAIAIVVALLLGNYIFIYLYIRNVIIMRNDVKERKNELEKKYLENKLALQTMQYEKSFNLIHNMVNEMQNIKHNYDQGQYDKLGEDINHLNTELIKEFNILYTNSKTLSVVLHNHLDEFTTSNIKVKSTLNYTDFTFMQEAEELALFEKVISYAISSCKEANDDYKFINIKTDLKNESLIMKIKFNYSNYVNEHVIDEELTSFIDKYKAMLVKEVSDDKKYYNLALIIKISVINDSLALEHKLNKAR